ncbi:riboflavin synthase subunit alpha [Glaesserella parasuis]|uniref:Riboflavin synthase subunit alpha n=2 Tax=Glaesserella parasuis TaxID=738 RepID=A0AAX1M324_GLAPU|nr:riboflavin synthase subunit alpha [Glaesserella parasuis]MCT8517825.1 riboflavin synthase subunit alpha [Glaesserella parasuis]MCT8549745.1 riboflavin synthase subunit alpha [Glaesserella parasuis]MCT8738053.1 riboflavin synthase subunit alpha [Glaesserella parasuis]MDG6335319.1 riboflavin synthase subunit alpha [Glaesserella parasuis]MDG6445975.1 riboflavin synthase subunit alpha [Glaesserella parasuis]
MTENIEPYLQPQKRQIIADKDKEKQLLKMAKEHYRSYADVAKFADALNLRAGIVYLTLKYHGFIKKTETTQYRVLDSYYQHNGDLKEITKDVGLTVWIVAKNLEQLNLSPNWASYKERAETGLKGDWAENEFKRLVPSAIDMNIQYQMNNPRFDFIVNNKEIDVKYSSVRKVRGSKQYALRYDPDNLPDFFCLFASDDEVEKSDDPPSGYRILLLPREILPKNKTQVNINSDPDNKRASSTMYWDFAVEPAALSALLGNI